jgi:hypothetical protein
VEVKEIFAKLTDSHDHSHPDVSDSFLASPEPVPRGPKLLLTSPEDERAIFQGKSEPPRNALMEALEAEAAGPEAGGSVSFVKDRVVHECSKAKKDDNAKVRPEKWDKILYLGLGDIVRARSWARAARTIRPLIARHWRRLQLRKWIRFVREKEARLEQVSKFDEDAARECLLCLQATTFWEWKLGSRPMFWNYPDDQQLTMRDDIVLWMKGRLDPWLESQRLPRDEKDIPKVIEKLVIGRDKGYIDVGLVKSLIAFFEVPKGLTDI